MATLVTYSFVPQVRKGQVAERLYVPFDDSYSGSWEDFLNEGLSQSGTFTVKDDEGELTKKQAASLADEMMAFLPDEYSSSVKEAKNGGFYASCSNKPRARVPFGA